MKAHVASGPSAFTLIELLVVISIITFLAVVLVVAAMKAIPAAKEKKVHALLNNLSQALTDYYNDFQAFPPATTSAGNEWWRYLTLSGSSFQRPRRYDGTIRQDVFIEEERLGIPQAGSPRLPKDAFGGDIEYVYPADNDAANITPQSDPTIPTTVLTMTAAQMYYYCVLISPGKDKLSTPAVPARPTNTAAYEAGAGNGDNLIKTVAAP